MKTKRGSVISLSQWQAKEALILLDFGRTLHEDFLMHDDWQHDLNAEHVKRTNRNHKRFSRAIDLLSKKLGSKK